MKFTFEAMLRQPLLAHENPPSIIRVANHLRVGPITPPRRSNYWTKRSRKIVKTCVQVVLSQPLYERGIDAHRVILGKID